jgi:anti-sigma B factor antagonist
MTMEITTREYKHAVVVRVVGRVDANAAPSFEAALTKFVEAGQKHLILELPETGYLSSAGVRALVTTQKTLKGKGGALFISQPSERVMEVLHIAGLDVLFKTYPTTEAALGDL